MKIVLTGGTGFIGKQLTHYLLKHTDAKLNLVVRSQLPEEFDQRVTVSSIPEINAETNWESTLTDCDVIVHTAGRVHILNENIEDPLQAYRNINVAGTVNLAQQAIKAKVKRFIFLSTIKVNGESTLPNKPFEVDDPVSPECPYALSKYEAEQKLLELAAASNMEVVILRPVLVYGPGVKGNFESLINWLYKGVPLPLGRIDNKRSFLSVENLCNLIVTCLSHPNAANQIFLVSDGHDLSTTELLKKLNTFLPKRVFLLPIPVWLLKLVAHCIQQTVVAERVCDSLQVSISKARDLLNWSPALQIDEALHYMMVAENQRRSYSVIK